MVSFWVYDVIFLIAFAIFVTWFLYYRRENLKREGIMFLYRTQLGVRAINYIGTKWKKFLEAIKYLVIVVGFGLMISMLYILGQVVYTYISVPAITEIIKAPPIAPLIPYFPELFGLQSFFPPFYFTYFLLALAIVAIVHEFSHGIYMKLFNVKIKSTGIVFLGPIFGAFVEEDRNSFVKKEKIKQMTILGAGTFANVLTALIFYGLLVGFFFLAFSPSGYVFNSYATSIIQNNSITSFGEEVVGDNNYSLIFSGGEKYFLDENLKKQIELNYSLIVAYEDTPAFRNQIVGVIVQANDVKIKNQEDIRIFLESKSPGDEIVLTTLYDGENRFYNIVLAEHPLIKGKSYLGVGYSESQPSGIFQKIIFKFINFKKGSTYYSPVIDGNFVVFIYNLLWWVMIINILVALFNMLPVGILDGGRFFYLSILGITKSEKISNAFYKIITALILSSFVLITIIWFFRII